MLVVGVNQGVNGINQNPIENKELEVESLDNIGQIPNNSLNPDNPLNQIVKLMLQTKKNFDISDVISKLRSKKSRKDK